MRNQMLVCEGECNPERALIDVAVASEREQGALERMPFSDSLLARLRTLKHTEHERVNGQPGVFRCTRCGVARVH